MNVTHFSLESAGSQFELHIFFVYSGFLPGTGNNEANGQGKLVRTDFRNTG